MTATRGRGRPRDPATDAAILRAAFELFVERGVDGASIEQIAKRAGVGKLTVYRRWSTKEDLLAQAIEESVVTEVEWPSEELIAEAAPYDLVEAALSNAAEAASDPQFRALVARILGSSVSHPALMATYWNHYVLPRRALTSNCSTGRGRPGRSRPGRDAAVPENALPSGRPIAGVTSAGRVPCRGVGADGGRANSTRRQGLSRRRHVFCRVEDSICGGGSSSTRPGGKLSGGSIRNILATGTSVDE